ncbi:MAG: hypothetical protein DWQ19_08845 [Crenarchaeota archaeon]|nr:MAG: hypothetical protein DWQ19_08845 [Thermoproteota archaeon]
MPRYFWDSERRTEKGNHPRGEFEAASDVEALSRAEQLRLHYPVNVYRILDNVNTNGGGGGMVSIGGFMDRDEEIKSVQRELDQALHDYYEAEDAIERLRARLRELSVPEEELV